MTTAMDGPPSTDEIPSEIPRKVGRFARRLPPVHRLAEALLRDGGAAEQILRQSEVEAESTLDWVTGVIKSVTVDVFRRRKAAEPEPKASPMSNPITVEAARGLATAVLELLEPYGEAVRLRYLDGLPSRDIVARLHIPEDAVRARITVGLTLLRDELDLQNYNSRQRWARALLPLIE